MGRTRARMAGAVAAMGLLAGCGVFHHEDKEKTPVLGERIPVLTAESGSTLDPTISALPVDVPAPVTNPNWPQPEGGPQHDIGPVTLAAQPSVVWTAQIRGTDHDERLAAAPVVADGRVYVMDTRAVVHAFDAKTGRAIWTTQVVGGQEGPNLKAGGILGKVGLKERKQFARSLYGGGVSFDNGTLYATNGLGEAAALNASTGKILWHVTPGGPLRGAPTVANGAVYVMSQDNQIFALNQTDGTTQWNASGPLVSAGIFGVGAPAVGHSTVIAGFSSGDLDAYRYENGRIVWQDTLTRTNTSTSVGDVTDVDADPVMDETRVYAVGAGGRTVGFDLVTGQRIWEDNIGGIATPAIGGEWLFVVGDDAKLYAIQRSTGKIRWTTQLQRWRNPKKQNDPITWRGPVIAGGRLLLVNTRGELVFASPQTGKVEATVHADKKAINLPPVVADNMLYILGSDGRLTAWR